jgi:hypothetical protein
MLKFLLLLVAEVVVPVAVAALAACFTMLLML